MAITRTPIIDDDGSLTLGTTLDWAWYQEWCDQIDALAVAPKVPFSYGPGVRYTLPGTLVNDLRPPGGELVTPWNLVATATTDMTGIAAEGAGRVHLLTNQGAPLIYFHNQHPSSLAANRFICPGFAPTYQFPAWTSVWAFYVVSAGVSAWLILKP